MTEFDEALRKAAEAADIALGDLLADRDGGNKIDTKTLKDVTAALKDLGGLLGESAAGDGCVTVCFTGGTEEAAV